MAAQQVGSIKVLRNIILDYTKGLNSVLIKQRLNARMKYCSLIQQFIRQSTMLFHDVVNKRLSEIPFTKDSFESACSYAHTCLDDAFFEHYKLRPNYLRTTKQSSKIKQAKSNLLAKHRLSMEL